jgi:hypothetical protein
MLLLRRLASMVSAPSLLLALPDPCLLAVLQHVAAVDQRSLFSAARAHSRLHQAAAFALHSITAHVNNQQHLDSVLLYLEKHGQHVDSIQLSGVEQDLLFLFQLPSHLQLSKLQFEHFCLQLQPGHGSHGVLGPTAAGTALKQLRLKHCKFDSSKQLEAVLSQLPAGLEHLSMSTMSGVVFPNSGLQRLQQLTYLELAEVELEPEHGQPALQPLQALTLLQDLRIRTFNCGISDSMLSGTHHLTRLDVSGCGVHRHVPLEPGVLAGKTRLHHLQLEYCEVSGGAAGAAQLLSHLQPLQLLTHLDLGRSKWEGNPSEAAFSALTASSKLQHLDIQGCRLPPGVWHHVFSAGRQLPHLTSLKIAGVSQPIGWPHIPPEGSRLVRCCPGLQSLNVMGLLFGQDFLAGLQGLRRLHTLHLCVDRIIAADRWHGVCQLTRLRELTVRTPAQQELLLHLTQFRQLTALTYVGAFGGVMKTISLAAQVSGALISGASGLPFLTRWGAGIV